MITDGNDAEVLLWHVAAVQQRCFETERAGRYSECLLHFVLFYVLLPTFLN